MSVFCLIDLPLNLVLVISIFASWKLYYAHVGASQNMHLSQKKKNLILKTSIMLSSEVPLRPGGSAPVILFCFAGETKPYAFIVQPTQPQNRMSE